MRFANEKKKDFKNHILNINQALNIKLIIQYQYRLKNQASSLKLIII